MATLEMEAGLKIPVDLVWRACCHVTRQYYTRDMAVREKNEVAAASILNW
jgi:hypothetical protein